MGVIYEHQTIKEKARNFGNTVKAKCQNAMDYLEEHKHVLWIVLPIAGAITTTLIKTISKAASNRKTEEIKRKYIYDPSGGFYWPTRRALTGKEKLELDERHRNGETIGQILVDMGLLRF